MPHSQSQPQSVRPGVVRATSTNAPASAAKHRPSPLDTRSETGSVSQSLVDSVRPVLAAGAAASAAAAVSASAGAGAGAGRPRDSIDLPGRGQSGPTSPAIPENNLRALAAQAQQAQAAGGKVSRAVAHIDTTVMRQQNPQLPGSGGKSWLPRSASKNEQQTIR